jgi:hypothetical protein
MKNLLFLALYIIYGIVVVLVLLRIEDSNASNTNYRIAIIDDGYDELYSATINAEPLKICPTGSYDFNSNIPGVHYSGHHGTIVGSIIAKKLKNVNYCAVIYKVFPTVIADAKPTDLIRALAAAQTEGFTAINMSYNGATGFILEEALMRNLGAHGVKMFIAAGNENHNLDSVCDAFPTCYLKMEGATVVGALQDSGKKCRLSNYGSIVNAKAFGTLDSSYNEDVSQCATSFATPRILSDYILSLVKLPTAVPTTITPPSSTHGQHTTNIKGTTRT